MAGLEGATATGGEGGGTGGAPLSTEVFDFLPSILNIVDEVIDNEEGDDDNNNSSSAAAASSAPAELQQQLAKARAYLASLPCIEQSLPELQGDLQAARAELAPRRLV